FHPAFFRTIAPTKVPDSRALPSCREPMRIKIVLEVRSCVFHPPLVRITSAISNRTSIATAPSPLSSNPLRSISASQRSRREARTGASRIPPADTASHIAPFASFPDRTPPALRRPHPEFAHFSRIDDGAG